MKPLCCEAYSAAACYVSTGACRAKANVAGTFELFWLLCCITPKGTMNRAHAYTAIIDKKIQISTKR